MDGSVATFWPLTAHVARYGGGSSSDWYVLNRGGGAMRNRWTKSERRPVFPFVVMDCPMHTFAG